MNKRICNNKIVLLLTFILFTIILNNISRPNVKMSALFLVLTLSYFLWRTSALQKKLVACITILLIMAYWFSEVYWRVSVGILYYDHFSVDVPIRYVSKEKAVVGALGYIIIAFALFYDFSFGRITLLKKKYLYINIDLVNINDKQWHNEIKKHTKNKQKLIAYSKKGSQEARYKAKTLRLEEYFVDFKSNEEVEKERGW